MSTDSTEKCLKRLSLKQAEWKAMSLTNKIELLEKIKANLSTSMVLFKETATQARNVMGYPGQTVEGRFQEAEQYLMTATSIHGALESYIMSYKVAAGLVAKPKLTVSRKENGQWAIKTFPVLPSEKFGALAKAVGEVYLDPMVKEQDITTFDIQHFHKQAKSEQAMIVLGAGNYGFLAIEDVIYGLFQCNYVVLLKHHPLRNYQDRLVRAIFDPLIQAGYFECQTDDEFDKKAIYSPLVAQVHTTGGKLNHDTIVWGVGEKEQAQRKRSKQPLLQAKMTSELGCVTPWIMAPYDYTDNELSFQSKNLAHSVMVNCSFSCNAPKVVIVSSDWAQSDNFIDSTLEYMKTHLTPVAYYPGAADRWNKFRKVYPQAETIECGLDAKTRELHRPDHLSQGTPILLPWLIIRVEVDLSTEEGRNKAKNEFAFRNEPFAPILTIATIKSSSEQFLEQATTVSNDFLFGSLSCSVVAPQKMVDSMSVQDCLDNLKYGSVVLNSWSAFGYLGKALTWGAFPGEELHAVESGIGQIHNAFFIPHIEKSVLKTPTIGDSTMFPEDLAKGAVQFTAITDFVLAPSLVTMSRFVGSMINVKKMLGVLSIAAGALGVAVWATRR